MPRIRAVKPELFTHEGLYRCESTSRLPTTQAFIALLCVADREGRFKWRPGELKLHRLPYHDVDFAPVLEALRTHEFIIRYEVDGEFHGVIPGFTKHQVVNNREMASKLPAPPGDTETASELTRGARVPDTSSTRRHAASGELGNGKELELERKGMELEGKGAGQGKGTEQEPPKPARGAVAVPECKPKNPDLSVGANPGDNGAEPLERPFPPLNWTPLEWWQFQTSYSQQEFENMKARCQERSPVPWTCPYEPT